MNTHDFQETWKVVRDRLGKRAITDKYIEYNSDLSKNWNEKIVQEMFAELSSANPSKTELDVSQIKSIYWSKFRDAESPKNGSLKECSHGICNGFGIVIAEREKPLYGVNGYTEECAFRCTCFMGNNHSDRITKWSEEKKLERWLIKQDSVYVDGLESKQQNIYTISSRISEICDKTEMETKKEYADINDVGLPF